MTHGVPAAVARAGSVGALLRALMASDPGRPRLTWYGPGGERVELSARVLANWVAKTGNLLVEELDVEPGSVVALDLPPHWRTVVLALSSWSVGACLATEADAGAEVLVSCAPGGRSGVGATLAVALPALARHVDAVHGPWWDVDYNAAVTGFDDVAGHDVDDDPAGVLPAARSAAAARGWPVAARVLAPAAAADLVDVVLAALSADGSVVLVGDPELDVERLAATENVSSRV